MNFYIETDRFILREFRMSDIDDLYEMDVDPEVHKYLGNNPIKSKAEVEKYITAVIQQYKDFGIGRWIIEDKETGECVGWSGLKYETSDIDQTMYYDLGYRLKRKHWGKGIAMETSEAAIEFGFDNLNLKKISAAAHKDNAASNKILEKLGFKQTQEYFWGKEPCFWYDFPLKDYLNKTMQA